MIGGNYSNNPRDRDKAAEFGTSIRSASKICTSWGKIYWKGKTSGTIKNAPPPEVSQNYYFSCTDRPTHTHKWRSNNSWLCVIIIGTLDIWIELFISLSYGVRSEMTEKSTLLVSNFEMCIDGEMQAPAAHSNLAHAKFFFLFFFQSYRMKKTESKIWVLLGSFWASSQSQRDADKYTPVCYGDTEDVFASFHFEMEA